MLQSSLSDLSDSDLPIDVLEAVRAFDLLPNALNYLALIELVEGHPKFFDLERIMLNHQEKFYLALAEREKEF